MFGGKDRDDRFGKMVGWQDFNGIAALGNSRHRNIRGDAESERGLVDVETRERFSGDT